MNLITKTAVAAAALALAGGAAHAATQNMASQNSSLLFIAVDSVGSPVSFSADLGYFLNDVLPTTDFNALNTRIEWNFANNTRTVNGVVQSDQTNAWSAPFADFQAIAQSNELRWAVVAGDSQQGARYVTTGIASVNNLANSGTVAQTLATSSLMTVANNLYNNNIGTHLSADNGAHTVTSGNQYVGNTQTFNAANGWNNGLRWSPFSRDGATTLFSFINVQPRPGATTLAQVTTYGAPNLVAPSHMTDGILNPNASTFMFDSSTSTLTWVTPVPEPGTYALLLAGLATVGLMVNRRRRQG